MFRACTTIICKVCRLLGCLGQVSLRWLINNTVVSVIMAIY